MENKLKVYLAGGWFSPGQYKILIELEELLAEYSNLIVYSPRKQTQFEPGTKPTREICEKVFNNNITAIRECDIIIASTEGKDLGTTFEMGIAYQLNKPIIAIYFHEEPFNLMLEESAIGGVARNIIQLESILRYIKDVGLEQYLKEIANEYRYQGLIE
jgi:nucleoside deoxyribosyltransferase